MITINRTAIIGMPGHAFLDWLHRADPTSGGLSLEDLRREPAARGHLEEVRGEVFEEQLSGWYRVPSLWPSGVFTRRRSLSATRRRSRKRFDSRAGLPGSGGYPRFQFLDVTR